VTISGKNLGHGFFEAPSLATTAIAVLAPTLLSQTPFGEKVI
jgi:hypothetical protein